MDGPMFIPDWRERITYSAPGPQPTILVDEPELRILIAGLEAGGRIPPHPERFAVYHFLEGTGTMIVDGERHAVRSGSTVITPVGASRGMEAETRLAFLATRVGGEFEPAS